MNEAIFFLLGTAICISVVTFEAQRSAMKRQQDVITQLAQANAELDAAVKSLLQISRQQRQIIDDAGIVTRPDGMRGMPSPEEQV